LHFPQPDFETHSNLTLGLCSSSILNEGCLGFPLLDFFDSRYLVLSVLQGSQHHFEIVYLGPIPYGKKNKEESMKEWKETWQNEITD
jgi:hypothetical protein